VTHVKPIARVLAITPWLGGFVDTQVSALRTRFDVTVGKVWPTDGPREWVATMNRLRGLRFDPYGYDIVHCFSAWPAGVYATSWGRSSVPLVIHEHLSPPERLIQLPVSRAFKYAAAVMCPSKSQADSVRMYTGREARVVPNPVVVPSRVRSVPKQIGSRPIEVACFGRYERQKGFDIAARASRVLAGVRFTFIGKGSEEATLRAAAKDDSRFFPWMDGSRSTAAAVAEFADIVCCPSRHESFGLACGEAVAMGIPVVATDEGMHRELIGDAGVICTATDASVVSAIAHVAGNLEAYQQRAQERSSTVRSEFAPQKFVEQVEAVYVEACASNGGGMGVA